MRNLLLASVAALACAMPAVAQTDQGGRDIVVKDRIVITTPEPIDPRDIVVAKGVRLSADEPAETIDVTLPTSPEGLTLAHPAEILSTVAGVNIHRGSGQEHLTAIRSPVM